MYCFFDKKLRHEVINLSPGEFFSSGKGMPMHTLLGAGITIALYDQETKLGGMNHFIVSRDPKSDDTLVEEYGRKFIKRFIDDFIRKGADKSNLQAKLYGGAVFSDEHRETAEYTLTLIESVLESENIDIVEKNIGGEQVRKIYLYPDSFEVVVKRQDYNETDLESQVNAYRKRMKKVLAPAGRSFFSRAS